MKRMSKLFGWNPRAGSPLHENLPFHAYRCGIIPREDRANQRPVRQSPSNGIGQTRHAARAQSHLNHKPISSGRKDFVTL